MHSHLKINIENDQEQLAKRSFGYINHLADIRGNYPSRDILSEALVLPTTITGINEKLKNYATEDPVKQAELILHQIADYILSLKTAVIENGESIDQFTALMKKCKEEKDYLSAYAIKLGIQEINSKNDDALNLFNSVEAGEQHFIIKTSDGYYLFPIPGNFITQPNNKINSSNDVSEISWLNENVLLLPDVKTVDDVLRNEQEFKQEINKELADKEKERDKYKDKDKDKDKDKEERQTRVTLFNELTKAIKEKLEKAKNSSKVGKRDSIANAIEKIDGIECDGSDESCVNGLFLVKDAIYSIASEKGKRIEALLKMIDENSFISNLSPSGKAIYDFCNDIDLALKSDKAAETIDLLQREIPANSGSPVHVIDVTGKKFSLAQLAGNKANPVYQIEVDSNKRVNVILKIGEATDARSAKLKNLPIKLIQKWFTKEYINILFTEGGRAEANQSERVLEISAFSKKGSMLSQKSIMETDERQQYAMQCLNNLTQMMKELNEHDIYFPDIKPGNIIITPDNRLVISDTKTLVNLPKEANPHKVGMRGITTTTEYEPADTVSPQNTIDLIRLQNYLIGLTIYEFVTGEFPAKDPKSGIREFNYNHPAFTQNGQKLSNIIAKIQALTSSPAPDKQEKQSIGKNKADQDSKSASTSTESSPETSPRTQENVKESFEAPKTTAAGRVILAKNDTDRIQPLDEILPDEPENEMVKVKNDRLENEVKGKGKGKGKEKQINPKKVRDKAFKALKARINEIDEAGESFIKVYNECKKYAHTDLSETERDNIIKLENLVNLYNEFSLLREKFVNPEAMDQLYDVNFTRTEFKPANDEQQEILAKVNYNLSKFKVLSEKITLIEQAQLLLANLAKLPTQTRQSTQQIVFLDNGMGINAKPTINNLSLITIQQLRDLISYANILSAEPKNEDMRNLFSGAYKTQFSLTNETDYISSAILAHATLSREGGKLLEKIKKTIENENNIDYKKLTEIANKLNLSEAILKQNTHNSFNINNTLSDSDLTLDITDLNLIDDQTQSIDAISNQEPDELADIDELNNELANMQGSSKKIEQQLPITIPNYSIKDQWNHYINDSSIIKSIHTIFKDVLGAKDKPKYIKDVKHFLTENKTIPTDVQLVYLIKYITDSNINNEYKEKAFRNIIELFRRSDFIELIRNYTNAQAFISLHDKNTNLTNNSEWKMFIENSKITHRFLSNDNQDILKILSELAVKAGVIDKNTLLSKTDPDNIEKYNTSAPSYSNDLAGLIRLANQHLVSKTSIADSPSDINTFVRIINASLFDINEKDKKKCLKNDIANKRIIKRVRDKIIETLNDSRVKDALRANGIELSNKQIESLFTNNSTESEFNKISNENADAAKQLEPSNTKITPSEHLIKPPEDIVTAQQKFNDAEDEKEKKEREEEQKRNAEPAFPFQKGLTVQAKPQNVEAEASSFGDYRKIIPDIEQSLQLTTIQQALDNLPKDAINLMGKINTYNYINDDGYQVLKNTVNLFTESVQYIQEKLSQMANNITDMTGIPINIPKEPASLSTLLANAASTVKFSSTRMNDTTLKKETLESELANYTTELKILLGQISELNKTVVIVDDLPVARHQPAHKDSQAQPPKTESIVIDGKALNNAANIINSASDDTNAKSAGINQSESKVKEPLSLDNILADLSKGKDKAKKSETFSQNIIDDVNKRKKAKTEHKENVHQRREELAKLINSYDSPIIQIDILGNAIILSLGMLYTPEEKNQTATLIKQLDNAANELKLILNEICKNKINPIKFDDSQIPILNQARNLIRRYNSILAGETKNLRPHEIQQTQKAFESDLEVTRSNIDMLLAPIREAITYAMQQQKPANRSKPSETNTRAQAASSTNEPKMPELDEMLPPEQSEISAGHEPTQGDGDSSADALVHDNGQRPLSVRDLDTSKLDDAIKELEDNEEIEDVNLEDVNLEPADKADKIKLSSTTKTSTNAETQVLPTSDLIDKYKLIYKNHKPLWEGIESATKTLGTLADQDLIFLAAYYKELATPSFLYNKNSEIQLGAWMRLFEKLPDSSKKDFQLLAQPINDNLIKLLGEIAGRHLKKLKDNNTNISFTNESEKYEFSFADLIDKIDLQKNQTRSDLDNIIKTISKHIVNTADQNQLAQDTTPTQTPKRANSGALKKKISKGLGFFRKPSQDIPRSTESAPTEINSYAKNLQDANQAARNARNLYENSLAPNSLLTLATKAGIEAKNLKAANNANKEFLKIFETYVKNAFANRSQINIHNPGISPSLNPVITELFNDKNLESKDTFDKALSAVINKLDEAHKTSIGNITARKKSNINDLYVNIHKAQLAEKETIGLTKKRASTTATPSISAPLMNPARPASPLPASNSPPLSPRRPAGESPSANTVKPRTVETLEGSSPQAMSGPPAPADDPGRPPPQRPVPQVPAKTAAPTLPHVGVPAASNAPAAANANPLHTQGLFSLGYEVRKLRETAEKFNADLSVMIDNLDKKLNSIQRGPGGMPL